jgi:hypothetical protein
MRGRSGRDPYPTIQEDFMRQIVLSTVLFLGIFGGIAPVSHAQGAEPKAAKAAKAPNCVLNAHGVFVCKARLKVKPNGKLEISQDPFPLPMQGTPVRAVWILTQPQYTFEVGDGIFVEDQDGQFVEPCATGAEDGECTTVSGPKRFRIKVLNSTKINDTYCVKFTKRVGSVTTTLQFDPVIANSFGTPRKLVVPPSNCH